MTVLIDRNDLQHRYLDLQQSTPDIARVYGCSKPTILERLREYQIPVRIGKDAHNTQLYLKKFMLEIPEIDLRRKYLEEKLGMPEIAIQHKCSNNCVRNNLLRYRIPIRSKSEIQDTPAGVVGREKQATWSRSLEAREVRRQSNINRYKSPEERRKTGLIMHKYHIEHPEFSKQQTQILMTRREDPEVKKKTPRKYT